jgi:hypothetical protein
MALANVTGPRYVRRTRLFADSSNRLPVESDDNFQFAFAVETEVQNVVALELVDFQLPRMLAPTFLDQTDYYYFLKTGEARASSEGANSVIDVVFTSESGADTLSLTSDLARPLRAGTEVIPTAGTVLDEIRVAQYLEYDLYKRLALAAHPVLNNANYLIQANASRVSTLLVTLENRASPGSFASVRFLFGTGPNRLRQASEVLGFRPYMDTEPATNNGAEAPFSVNPYPWRYLDVDLAEAAELRPFARVYMQDEVFPGNSTPSGFPRAPRLLKRPVRSLKRLRFRLRLAGGRRPAFASDVPMQLTVDALSLEKVPLLPAWVEQRFAM